MPGVLWRAPILRKFLGSGGENFPICPGFCSRRKFSGIFWAVATGIFLYARDFVADSNSQKISRQWREVFLYMPGILWRAPILRKFLGSGDGDFPYMPRFLLLALVLKKFPSSGDGDFPICPEFYSRRQSSGNFRALATGIFPICPGIYNG